MKIDFDLSLNDDNTIETWFSSPSITGGVQIGGLSLGIMTVETALRLLLRSEVVIQAVKDELGVEKLHQNGSNDPK